ncbi:MAG: pyrroline-5-carboxylate reductase [Gammaproteobacteria bacterium]|nr:pyrroline-5-carboxylate reductase [Gammaproteobacteria bacterium]
MYKIGFLGMGKMGSSILSGILKNGIYKNEEIAFYAPSEETQKRYKNIGINLVKNERDLFINSKIIILAIKPQKYDEIFSNLEGINFKEKTIISLAPGKSIAYLKNKYKYAKIVRIMPNTPALIGRAVTTVAFDNDEDLEVLKIVKSVGEYLVVNESQIDELIPLNGSMPAYLFEFAKSFIKCGVEFGISESDARRLVFNSIIGSAELALNSDDDIDTLINNVCSKGGSTIEGLNELRNNGFNEAIKKCYHSCVRRSKELGSSN